MSVIIGSARIDERGCASGGQAGDQNGEVSTQAFYMHTKGWIILRAKRITTRELIARNMQYACDNNNIGYDQSERYSLINNAKQYGYDCSRVKTPCETDCSALVRVCVNYAGISVGDFNTASEKDVLLSTGEFNAIDFTSESKLIRGDILVTKTKGHTVVVLANGIGSGASVKTAGRPIVRYGDCNKYVGEMQQLLLNKRFKSCVIDGKKKYLTVDNDFGPITLSILKRYQGYVGLEADGECGPLTWSKLLC